MVHGAGLLPWESHPNFETGWISFQEIGSAGSVVNGDHFTGEMAKNGFFVVPIRAGCQMYAGTKVSLPHIRKIIPGSVANFSSIFIMAENAIEMAN